MVALIAKGSDLVLSEFSLRQGASGAKEGRSGGHVVECWLFDDQVITTRGRLTARSE